MTAPAAPAPSPTDVERRGARTGSGRLVARLEGGRTVLAEAHATSPLRFVRPDFPTRSAGVCLVTFGGGLVDGDAIDTAIDVGPGATLLVFTQASTKVFRGASRQSIRARVAGTLVLLPDPVAAFKDASYTQRVDVELTAPEASCVLLDGFTSGRAAYGERWQMRALDLRTTVRAEGRDVLVDALRLDGAIAEQAASFEAFLTLVAVGAGARTVAEAIAAAPPPPTRDLALATSPLLRAPGAALRVAASSPAAAIAAARARLRNLPDIDVVDPFSSRY
ncbi:MAG: urease accessory protein UreD [Labilithrix sp.]|nr:urease accessory protein UreD [Labilithrix sp.]MCW5814172.1 urease accessory protein UreD [Labilithrix sp.]